MSSQASRADTVPFKTLQRNKIKESKGHTEDGPLVKNLVKKNKYSVKTTEHHERNGTCVLEPNYNLAHAPLNPHSDLAYLLALAPPLLKLKQQSQFTV